MQFNSPRNFRDIITFSVLSAKNVSVIREEPFEPYELRFLDLISLVTLNSKFYLSDKKKKIDFKPGTIEQDIYSSEEPFDCGNYRSITYFLEPLIVLGLFSKTKLHIKFKGLTNDSIDLPVDLYQNALVPMLKEFYEGLFMLDIKTIQKGFRPSANGLVQFKVGSVKKTLPVLRQLNSKKLIKRIRGNAIAGKVSSQFLGRMISTVRDHLNDFIPDVWVYSELVKNSPDRFYGVSLYTNNFIVSDFCFDDLSDEEKRNPEEIARTAVYRLLDEIENSSEIVGTNFQAILLTLMAVAEKDVNACVFGRISEHSVWTLRLLKAFFGVDFKFKDHVKKNSDQNYVIASCVGCGLRNRTTELD